MRNIIAVSTDKGLLKSLAEVFRYIDFNVTTITNPELLFNELKVVKPDLLILDFILNDVNGGAVCHQITSDPETNKFPVVILADQPGLERFSKKSGSAAVIVKTADTFALAENILTVLKDDNYAIAV